VYDSDPGFAAINGCYGAPDRLLTGLVYGSEKLIFLCIIYFVHCFTLEILVTTILKKYMACHLNQIIPLRIKA